MTEQSSQNNSNDSIRSPPKIWYDNTGQQIHKKFVNLTSNWSQINFGLLSLSNWHVKFEIS